ncbi:MAG: ABC transporter ATP-binding protein [Candidatus Bathyarchaeia archaeon]|jgi:lipooligosaccharide transport system ATP-binding protein
MKDRYVTSENLVVEARELRKAFDTIEAVRGVDFDVTAGECFGFLGPNGAGKTTTMRMIGCVSPFTSGSLKVFGLDTRSSGRKIKQRLGVVPQEANLDEELPVVENLTVYARFFNIPSNIASDRAKDLLEFMELTEKRSARVSELSGGMRRRLLISRAMMNKPELLILDEPTTGLDPQARHLVWDKLFELKKRGVTQIVTTHYMDEAEQLCDRLAIMDQGHIIEKETPQNLIQKYIGREVVEIRVSDAEKSQILSLDTTLIKGHDSYRDLLILYSDDADKVLERIKTTGINNDYTIVRRSGLEDVFLKLTGRRITE